MPSYRCYVCRDLRPGLVNRFKTFDADAPVCPHCGAGEPAVVELTAVHWMAPDPGGPFLGADGVRRKIACEPLREVLALHAQDDYSASPDPRATTCRSCMGVPAWGLAAAVFKEMRAILLLPDKGGCCG